MNLARRLKRHLLAMAVIVVNLCCLANDGRPAAAQDELTESGTFKSLAEPFLAQYCVRCHGPEKQESKLRIDILSEDFNRSAATWEEVLEKLEAEEMPPEESPQPSQDARQRMVRWIRVKLNKEDELSAAGAKLLFPEKGNAVDHELLFGKPSAAAPATPARLWRVRPGIYQNYVIERTPLRNPFFTNDSSRGRAGGPFLAPWELRREAGFRDYAALYTVDEPETELLVRNATNLADSIITAAQADAARFAGGTAENRAIDTLIAAKTPLDDAKIEKGIDAVFRIALQRAPSAEESSRYKGFLNNNLKSTSQKDAVKLTIAAVLLHPEAVFRTELGDRNADPYGRVMLTDRELAFAVAFAVMDDGPDDELLSVANAGKLRNRDELVRQVTRLLIRPGIEQRRLLSFFQEYFGYAAAPEVFKDDETLLAAGLGRGYHNRSQSQNARPDLMVRNTDAFVLNILRKDRDVLREMLTSREFFVTTIRQQPHQDTILLHYNLTLADWSEKQPFEFPADQRMGILTHPSWLVAHSSNFDNHAIGRGRWIREHLLGGLVPDVPITVDAQLPDEPHKTLRERMTVTHDAYCWNCHRKMNPLGLAFEMYDHFGRFRKEELGKPVDASGEISESGDPSLDGPVASALVMIERLAASERVEQVFVRHAFRFWLGRNETPADAPTLVAAHQAYQSSGGSMKALVSSLIASDSFLYRIPITENSSP